MNPRPRHVVKSVPSLMGILAGLVAAPAVGASAEDLPREVAAILDRHCVRCHNPMRKKGKFEDVANLKALVASGKVVPREPEKSELYRRVSTSDQSQIMPRPSDERDGVRESLRGLNPDEIGLIRRWILAGAPAGDAPAAEGGRRWIPESAIEKMIVDDLTKKGYRSSRYTRYFSIAHLYNAGMEESDLQVRREALSKLVNSLSWERRIRAPAPIDRAKTVLRIDLRDYGWDEATWQAILDEYPYRWFRTTALLRPDEAPDRIAAQLAGEMRKILSATQYQLPWIRADWFVARASRPPLYDRLLDLPKTAKGLEDKLGIRVDDNIRKDRAIRTAIRRSRVSNSNRLLERHDSPYGAYWKSYDFRGNTDRRDLFSHPLGPGSAPESFRHDGGEIIFNLPNGLQGYMIVNDRGEAIEAADTAIVHTDLQADSRVVNGISCMSCHVRGINRPLASAGRFQPVEPADLKTESSMAITALYPPKEVFDDIQEEDIRRFGEALRAAGVGPGQEDPIFRVASDYAGDLGLRRVAAELGVPDGALRRWLDKARLAAQVGEDAHPETRRLRRVAQDFGQLLDGGLVRRDTFEAGFPSFFSVTWKYGTFVGARREFRFGARSFRGITLFQDRKEFYDEIGAGAEGR